ncbi:MAG: OmpA family protein [Bacteroidota bacterium]
MSFNSKSEAVKVGIQLSLQFVTASLGLLTVIGGLITYLLNNRSFGPWSIAFVLMGILCLLLSIFFGFQGIARSRNHAYRGWWSINVSSRKFDLQTYFGLTGIVFFGLAIAILLNNPKSERRQFLPIKENEQNKEVKLLNDTVYLKIVESDYHSKTNKSDFNINVWSKPIFIVGSILIVFSLLLLRGKDFRKYSIASLISGSTLLALDSLNLRLTVPAEKEYFFVEKELRLIYKEPLRLGPFNTGAYDLNDTIKFQINQNLPRIKSSDGIMIVGVADKRKLKGKISNLYGTNFELSSLRASSVKSYLIEKGVESNKLITLSKGGFHLDSSEYYMDRQVILYFAESN